MERIYEGYVISDDKSLVDVDRAHDMLLTTYWADKRPREVTEAAIAHSGCYGIYHEGVQVGFARIISDYSTTWYLADVVIDKAHRGKGLGKQLIDFITTHEANKGLMGLLITRDAHGLYESYGGFIKDPEIFMIRRPERKPE